MIVGLYQALSPAGDVPAGLATLDAALAQAAAAGVSMLVLPEMFLPGYNAYDGGPVDGLEAVPELVARHGVALTIGLPEFNSGAVYNSAFVYDSAGVEITRYRKVQLFGPREAELFKPGEHLVTFQHNGTCFGVVICYDIEFGEHIRALKRAGAEVILVPTANMAPFLNVNQFLVPARAMENALTVVYANYCGSEGDLDYVGHSVICGPDGYSLATLGHEPGLIVAELPQPGWSEHGVPLSTQLTDYRPAKAPNDS